MSKRWVYRKKILNKFLFEISIYGSMKKMILLGVLVTAVIIISAVVIIQPWRREIPFGWTYSSELSGQYVDEEYGENIPPCGCTYEIFIKDDLDPPDPPFPSNSLYIRLYICYYMESPERCDLAKSGIYQNGEFVWEDGI